MISEDGEIQQLTKKCTLYQRLFSTCGRCINLKWLRKPLGALKLFQLIIVLVPLIITFPDLTHVMDIGMLIIDIFFIVHSISLMMTILTIILYVANIFHHLLPDIMISNLVLTVCCGLGALMHAISSAGLIIKFTNEGNKILAGSFGLIAFFSFLIETIFYLVKIRRDGAYETTGIDIIILSSLSSYHRAPDSS